VKFVHLVRDGRDVVLSKHPTYPDEYHVEPERWIRDVREGARFLSDPRVYTLRYEDLILDHDKALRGLCGYLELEVAPMFLTGFHMPP
jgi:hypothetical protein